VKPFERGIQANLEAMVSRANSVQGYLNRNLYRQYQNAQRTRWQTEGASEGTKWLPLNPGYAKRKLVRFASYPGGGRKMMIATKRLFDAVVGPSGEHRKEVTSRSLTIGWTTPYAVYADEKRPFSSFSNKTEQQMYDGLAKYLIEGILREIT